MFINYLKIAIRNLFRDKGYAFINIAGLTVGIASCILILLFILNELSYDKYHDKSDRIYRVGIEAVFGDSHFFSAVTSGAMKDALLLEISDVEEACRLIPLTRPVIQVEDVSFIEDNFFYADSCFFNIFSVPLIKGDPATALARPNTAVISQDAANKYFGDRDPIGKTLRVNETYEIEVTGVSENMPGNSHFRYDILGSSATVRQAYRDYWRYWTTNNLYTYILAGENTSESSLEDQLQELVYKYVGPEVESLMNIDIATFEAGGGKYNFFLEKLPEIYLYSDADNQITGGGNVSYIYFFSIIAFFILLIACINFMNMATARYANRAKEVGIRKVVGSTRIQLIQQFFTESILISLLAIVFTVAIIELVLPYFNFLTSKELEIGYLSSWYILPSLVVFGLLVGILAGSYPAFFLSSFQPVRVLKGEVKAGGKSNRFRKILVVIQFTITISLITGTLLVSDQLEYWQSRDHGYEREGVLVLKRTHILGDRQKAFREELMKNEEIKNASFCSSLPGYDFGGTSFHRYGAPSEELVQTILIQTDEHYLETMNIELAEGRFFSQEYGTDEDAVVINETLVRVMGLQDPVNESIVFPHISIIAPVIGVIKDVNFESLHRNIRPMTIRKLVDPGWLMAIRIDNENIPDVISSIEQTWNDFTGEAPYIYSFLEDDLLELYSNEMRTGRIFTIFSVLAIIIACMGLLGMASFTTEKRTKEIGIRKAMGASMQSICLLLVKEVTLLIAFSTLFAWPVAWYIMNRWLENFSYRIQPGITTFVISTLIAFVIALLTVSYQVRKAAAANPVDSLKYE